MTSGPTMKPLEFTSYAEDEQRRRAREFLIEIGKRITVREFSDRPVPRNVLEDCIAAAATAPSGAHKQPWTFVLVTDPALKSRIREAAEKEERAFYGGRAPERWLKDLEPFGTDAHKPYLEIAPALIVVSPRSMALRRPPSGTTTSRSRWASPSDCCWRHSITPASPA